MISRSRTRRRTARESSNLGHLPVSMKTGFIDNPISTLKMIQPSTNLEKSNRSSRLDNEHVRDEFYTRTLYSLSNDNKKFPFSRALVCKQQECSVNRLENAIISLKKK